MNGIHHSILTPRILGFFQCVTMAVGDNSEGVHNVILDAGSDGVGVRGITTNARTSCICACYECLLGAGI
jgi:hypothetical protein